MDIFNPVKLYHRLSSSAMKILLITSIIFVFVALAIVLIRVYPKTVGIAEKESDEIRRILFRKFVPLVDREDRVVREVRDLFGLKEIDFEKASYDDESGANIMVNGGRHPLRYEVRAFIWINRNWLDRIRYGSVHRKQLIMYFGDDNLLLGVAVVEWKDIL